MAIFTITITNLTDMACDTGSGTQIGKTGNYAGTLRQAIILHNRTRSILGSLPRSMRRMNSLSNKNSGSFEKFALVADLMPILKAID